MEPSRFVEIRDMIERACLSYRADASIAYSMEEGPQAPAFVITAQEPTIKYNAVGMSSLTADWYWNVEYLAPNISIETAQAEMGAIISPGSDLVCALEESLIDEDEVGFSEVTLDMGTIGKYPLRGGGQYGYVRITMTIRA